VAGYFLCSASKCQSAIR